MSIRRLTGKKTKYFWHSSTVCLEPVCKIFIKTRFTPKSSECLCRDITGHASVPYSIADIHFVFSKFKMDSVVLVIVDSWQLQADSLSVGLDCHWYYYYYYFVMIVFKLWNSQSEDCISFQGRNYRQSGFSRRYVHWPTRQDLGCVLWCWKDYSFWYWNWLVKVFV